MMNLAMKKNIGWGGGGSDLFLNLSEEDGVKLIDVEFDSEEFFRHTGGGRINYTSRSGCTGSGWVRTYGDLIPVGYYRVDSWEAPADSIDFEGIRIYVPYIPHTKDKQDILKEYPVVLKDSMSRVYLCSLNGIPSLLRIILRGEEIDGIKYIEKIFYSVKDKKFHTTYLPVWNMENFHTSIVWRFYRELIEEFLVLRPEENLLRVLRLAQTPEGEWVKTEKLGGCYYATSPYNPSSEGLPSIPHCWRKLSNNVVYLLSENHVAVLAWKGDPRGEEFKELLWEVNKSEVLLFKEELLKRISGELDLPEEKDLLPEEEEDIPYDEFIPDVE